MTGIATTLATLAATGALAAGAALAPGAEHPAPRTAEARTDVRYFAAQGYDRIVVAGPRSTAAAHSAPVVRVADLPAALAAVTR